MNSCADGSVLDLEEGASHITMLNMMRPGVEPVANVLVDFGGFDCANSL